MICFGVGVVIGGMAGLCISGLFNEQEDSEKEDEWWKEYNRIHDRVQKAIHHATVIRDAAGYKHMAVTRFADEMISILQGDNEH